MKNKVFLGGTCNDSLWRECMIDFLEIDFFNPVVEDWTPECQKNEMLEKEHKCNVHLYVITKLMTGVFSIAEVMDSVHTRGKRTIFHVIPEGIDERQLRSLQAVVDLVNLRGGIAYIDNDLNRTPRLLNHAFN